ncbi:leucine-rich repeat-containing protein 74B-like isoform X2 [Mercenaria mercenaria]|nr:leucine-rich repeat-containing protein 74B-like isoform X2 [Mercenaria mercenaria]
MAKHRMNKGSTKRVKTGRKVVGRNRRRVSNTESDGGDSSRSRNSFNMYDWEVAGAEYPYDEEEIRDPQTKTEPCQDMYLRACSTFGVHPVASFYKGLREEKCILWHRNMTTDDIKAIAVALVGNSTIETLDLSDNDMGPLGAKYIADAMKENTFITNLNLSDNKLTALGVKYIVEIIIDQDTIKSLSIAGNGLRECDSEIIRPLFEHPVNLRHLDMSRNELRMAGGEVIGEALLENETIVSLDLSWNHLRRDGACFIADGLAGNTCLRKLNLAWNGFHLDGCQALARALEQNNTLTELDITCNRISKECLEKLMVGLKKNTTLEILRIGKNPVTPAGAMLLLEFLKDNKTTGIRELDITDQLVKPAFVDVLAEIKAIKDIKVIFGPVQGRDKRGDDDELTLMDENPTIVLMELGKLMGFRLLDLFAAFDKDGSKTLDHNEIKTGLRMVNIPLSDDCIDFLIKKLDVDGDGEIDFGELMAAQTEYRRKMGKFMAAQESDKDIENTEIGRIRIKLSRLMSKKMSGNPAFRRGVENMTKIITQQGEAKFAEKMGQSLVQRMRGSLSHYVDRDHQKRSESITMPQLTLSDKIRQWKPMN